MFQLLKILLLVSLLTGCAAIPESGEMDRYWWHARYRILPTETGDVNWPVDLMIAHRVIAPVLDHHRNNIQLWRFHRRAVDDVTGHQFSFLFYTDKRSAADIYSVLQKDELTQALIHKNILRRLIVDNLSANSRTAVSDTSDERWPMTVQKNWPQYIMGVSELWLGLVEDYADSTGDDIKDMLAEYSKVNNKIIELWHSENRHAFYHHMHALFGYPPAGGDTSVQENQ